MASLNPDPELQAYVIGLAIGDGNLSNPNGRATRLRISCDTIYPALLEKIASTLHLLLPDNKVSLIPRKARCMDVSVYSNHLEKLLGWKANGGSKPQQNICVPEWIMQDRRFMVACLRGLIETDGCIYHDRGYPAVSFSTVIADLAGQVHLMMTSLGFRPRLYCIPQRSYGKGTKYPVRLTRDVQAFLRLVKPLKA